MGAHLVVPRLLGLVGDGFLNMIVVLCGVFHVVVAAHGVLLMCVELGLQHVAEHLYVVAAGTIALRHESIDIAQVLVEAIGQSELRQQLGEGLRAAVDDVRGEMIGGLTLGGAACHIHIGQGVVVNLHLIYVKAQAEG